MSRFSENYPDNWRSLRRDVFERDDYRCRNCKADCGDGAETTPHCHHVVPISAGGSHEVDNLVTLCEVCHAQTHGEMRKVGVDNDYPAEQEFSGMYLPVKADGGEVPTKRKDESRDKSSRGLPPNRQLRRDFSLPYRLKWWLFGVPEKRKAIDGMYYINIPDKESDVE